MSTQLVEVLVGLHTLGAEVYSEDEHHLWLRPFEETFEEIPASTTERILQPGEETQASFLNDAKPQFRCSKPNASFDFTIIGAGRDREKCGGLAWEVEQAGYAYVFEEYLKSLHAYAAMLDAQDAKKLSDHMLGTERIGHWTYEMARAEDERQKEKIRFIRFITVWSYSAGWSRSHDGDEWDSWFDLEGVLDMSKLPIIEIPEPTPIQYG